MKTEEEIKNQSCCFKPTAFIGIDPGISKSDPGAAAMVYDKGYEYFDWKNEKQSADNLRRWDAKYNLLMVAIERQWPRPTDSKQNIGKIMKNYGVWIGICMSYFPEGMIFYPTPKEWQKSVCLVLKGQDPKSVYLAEARKQFPLAELKFKKNSGRAAALWLATYAKQHYRFHHDSRIH